MMMTYTLYEDFLIWHQQKVNSDAVGEARRGEKMGWGRGPAGRRRRTRNTTEEFD